jgi:hypothetical protein
LIFSPAFLPGHTAWTASYYFVGTDQEHWDLAKDFPNLAPPYPQFWCEHRLANYIHSKECGDSDLRHLVPHGRMGTLITAVDPKDVRGQDIPPNARWILWCELFIDYGLHKGDPITGPHGSVFLAVDAEGAIIGHPWMQHYAAEEHAGIMKDYMTWFHPTFLAISFLHCKNVTVEAQVMPAPLAKKFRARHPGVQPAKYSTLVIEPLKAILRTQGRSREVGLAKAMHICRGHFADYRQGRGLFGKYHGRFWWPSTVRGTKGKAAPREIEVKL